MKEDKRRFSSVMRDNAIHRMYEEEKRKAGDYAPYLSKGYYYGRIQEQTGLSFRMISLTSTAAEFLNSWMHEMQHLCRHVAASFGIDPYGEEAAYLAGDVGQKMFPVARRFLCDCCRKKMQE